MADHRYVTAVRLIDEAHAKDPKRVYNAEVEVPYELFYTQKMMYYLDQCDPNASETLRLAVRAQHLRRWEVPRDSYAMNKAGYHSWRTYLKKRQAELVARMCYESGYTSQTAERVAALVRKDNLKHDKETQILEDVACLVFLDHQFEDFEKSHDEAKVISILQKTWLKMSERGHDLAMNIPMSTRVRALITKALSKE